MLYLHQNLFLEFNIAEIVLLLQRVLVQHFHCIVCFLFKFFDEEDFGEGTLTQ